MGEKAWLGPGLATIGGSCDQAWFELTFAVNRNQAATFANAKGGMDVP
jgi:hypothetical protein